MTQQAFDHRGHLGRRCGPYLGVDADRAAFDVPVHHDPGAPVSLVPLGHEVRRPRPELAGVRRARRTRPPQRGVARFQGLVDHGADRGPQVVAVDEQPARTPQRRLGVGLARPGIAAVPSATRLIPMFVPSPYSAQQQPSAQDVLVQDGAEATEVNSPVNCVAWSTFLIRSSRSMTPHRRAISSLSAFRFSGSACLATGRDADPRLAHLTGDLHPAGGALLQRLVEPCPAPRHAAS